jgi:hypothetical protein
MMRRAAVRRGTGLVGTMARTAVVVGTATAVSGAVADRHNRKVAGQQAEIDEANQVQDMQAQLDAMQAQQAQAAVAQAAPAAAPAAAAPAANDIAGQLQQLMSLKNAGILSDAEFEAAKAKVLAG